MKNILPFVIFIILLLLLVILYRNYVYKYCENDLQCIQRRLNFKLNNLNNQLINTNTYQEMKNSNLNNQEIQEHFFGGLTNWFGGSSNSEVPISKQMDGLPGTLPNESLDSLENKIDGTTKKSDKFPPTVNLDGMESNEFKDSDNSEILNNIKNNKMNEISKLNNANLESDAIFSKKNIENKTKIEIKEPPKKKEEIKQEPIINKQLNKKQLFESCQFFSDSCPKDYYSLGNFSIQGITGNSILTCGDVQNTKPAKAIAEIRNNSVYEIHITDPGHGFNPESVPNISIEGGKGHGATAEAVIDDDGFLKIVKVINPGYNYSETPNVIIDAPFMNSSCHLCCKNE